MKMRNVFGLVLFAALALAIGLVIACGSSSSDDDDDDATTGDDTASTTSCDEAMTFMFGDSGCFTLKDSNGNVITPEDLCGGDYNDVAPCYIECYDDNDDCPTMQVCLTDKCGLQLG
jgi:hypothetical protein